MNKIYAYLLGVLLLLVSCEKDPEVTASYVYVDNEQVSATLYSLNIRCNIKSDVKIDEVRVEYATEEDDLDNYFVDNEKMTKSGSSYTASLTGLKENTYYYIRYKVEDSYSNCIRTAVSKHKTVAVTLPKVTTTDPINVSFTSATVGGNVTSDGWATVTERGVALSTSPNPTTADTKLVKGSGKGSYSINISNLKDSMTYYVRAYAVNSKGTSYGVQKKFITKKADLPSVTTADATNVSFSTATVGGNVTSDGGITVTERGIVLSTSPNPTTADKKLVQGSGTGSFSVSISNLKDATTYYVRAYALNGKGVSYGEQNSFTTKKADSPSVTTSDPTNVSFTTATVGGNVTSDGGAAVTERGIVLSTSPNPTTADTKLVKGSGTGSFSINISNLKDATTYYVRAYAVNSKGTSYGAQKSFTTKVYSAPSVTTSTATEVAFTTATIGGNVTSDGGMTVTERGIVYSTSPNPTTADTKLVKGSGIGSFSINISNLKDATTYYVRAYAVNSKGTSYGAQKSFTTKVYSAPSVTTSTATEVAFTTATIGGNVTSDGGMTVTERGIVYSTSPNPTTADTKIVKGSGSGTGSFSINISNLKESTTYYVCAYAINSKGVSYGEIVSFMTKSSVGQENGHNYVDLGLSVKWATCNVGAESPEDYGDYFAWGETEPKSTYNWDTYKWCQGSSTTLTKYCTSSSYGKVDNKTQLDLSDDAARANWGGSWRMPTHDELTELIEKCTWTWTTQNGVNGYKVTSQTNGKSIFLPAAGSRDNDDLRNTGKCGYYWSSSLTSGVYQYDSKYLYCYSSKVGWYAGVRCAGTSVRSVCE